MTIYRVWHASTDGTKDGSTWAKAFASITNATVLAATGGTDQIWVASDHDEEGNAPTNVVAAFTGGTRLSAIEIYSVKRADDTYENGALIRTDGGNITLTGNVRSFGVTWFADGASRDLNIGTTDNEIVIENGGAKAGDDFNISGVEAYVRFINSVILCNNAAPSILLDLECRASFHNCVITHATTDEIVSLNDNAHALFEDCDLSTDSDYIARLASGLFRASVIVRRCKLKSTSVGIFKGSEIPSDEFSFGIIENSSSAVNATPLGLNRYESWMGSIVATTSIYRTGGANDGAQANAYVWTFDANTNSREFWRPLRSPPISLWVPAGEVTITVYVATDSVTLQNDECWLEIHGPDNTATSTARGYKMSTKPGASASLPDGNPLASPANLTTDGDSTWNGSGVGTKQKLTLTYTPDQPGPISVVVCVANKTDGVTVQVDPKPVVSTIAGSKTWFSEGTAVIERAASAYGLTAAILKDDEVVDDVTGEYAGGGGYTYGDEDASQVLTTADGEGTYHAPDAAEVIHTAVFGPSSGTSGTYHAPEVSEVKKGAAVGATTGTLVGIVDSGGTRHDYGTCSSVQAWAAAGIVHTSGTAAASGILNTGGAYAASGVFAGGAGTIYATTGLSVGQVLDSVAVWRDGDGDHAGTYHEATTGEVKDGTTFGAGETLTGTYSPGGTYVEGQAAQLAADQAEVGAVAGSISTTVTGLLGTVDGTLDLSLYTLITGVAAAADVRSGVARYSGGEDGTCAVPGPEYVQFGIAIDATTGTLVGIIDGVGAVYGWGMLDKSNVWHAGGIMNSTSDYFSDGVLDASLIRSSLDYATEAAGGTYHEAATSEVIFGVSFGPNETLAGEAIPEFHTPNQVLKSAGGNYDDDNLSVGNVRPVAFGLGLTGTLANLVATDAAYVSLEEMRNNDNGTVAGDIVSGNSVKIRNTTITGTYDPGAAYDNGYAAGLGDQLASDIAAVEAGKAGMTTTTTILTVTGTLNLSLYVLIANVVDAAWVVVGQSNYVGGDPGEYPTTATSQAAQLATDQAAVLASAAWIVSGHSILGQAGTFDEAARNTDPGVANVLDGVTYTILGVAKEGMLPAGGGGGGTYPDEDYVHADAGDYGPTGTEYTPGLSALENWYEIAAPEAPPITPAWSHALALESARQTLAVTTVFAERVAAADPGALAATHIWLDEIADNDGLSDHRPYALLKYCDRGSTVIAEGIQVDLIVSGGIVLWLEFDARSDLTDHDDQYVDACNFFGGVIDQMETLSGSGDYLPFRSEMIVAPHRTSRKDRRTGNDYWWAAYLLVYGDQL